MQNMKSRINILKKKGQKQNHQLKQEHVTKQIQINNKCLSNNILYKANIISAIENYRNEIYYDISETKFELRYANRWKSLKNQKYKIDIELSNEIWKLKEQNKKVGKKVGNCRDTLIEQHINKTMHVMSKRKISNSAPQRR